MKVLVAERIAEGGMAHMEGVPDIEVVKAFGCSRPELLRLVRDVDAIVVRSKTQVDVEVMDGAPRLKAIGRAGVGVDNIDVESATARGIVVFNSPEGNTIATAELTFSHILCTARPIAQAWESMRNGGWDRGAFSGTELRGKTLGVIGLGRVGSEVANRARVFGMRVLACDPFLTAERAQAIEVTSVDFEELLAQSDFITVHVPLTHATRNLIDAAAFERMKPGVRIINCARGGIVDEDALLVALKSGKVAAAGLDVYDTEPVPQNHPLRGITSLVLTPHLGASTREAQESVGLEIARAVTEVLRSGVVRNAVNLPSVDPATRKTLRPYLLLGEKLGRVLQAIAPSRVDRLIIEYRGRVVDLDASPLTRCILQGYLRDISGENVNSINAPYLMKRLGIEIQVTKSSKDADYMELIRIAAVGPDGSVHVIEGTLIGTGHRPRLVHFQGRDVEVSLEKSLLVLENEDRPGVIGTLGTILGSHEVNIAGMSVNRNIVGGMALTALELDTVPEIKVIREIESQPGIGRVHRIAL